MQKIITGIQQVGIGVTNANEAWAWYSKYFGMDVVIFNDAAPAPLMTRYTGGEVHHRYAVLAVNMQSGGGFEIWEYKSRKAQPPAFKINLGDTGIQIIKIKCRDINAAYEWYDNENLKLKTEVHNDPQGKSTFYMEDPYGNKFQLVEDNYWYMQTGHLCGGIVGVTIAVSSMEKAMNFYSNVLNIRNMVYDVQNTFDEWKGFEGGDKKFRRILLKQHPDRMGAFSKLVGPCTIELIQALDYTPRKIFENRLWGDQGYIHLCFDVVGMELLEADCKQLGYPFTIDSATSFDMGDAAGHFAYNEDPDGTLIEFVEAHKVPILKKLGWYFNLKKRDATQPLPDWMVKALRFNRKKELK
jgi:catechol 2,3-dioxygenase-like lactoylglutathione lyase family enzyme